MTLTFDQLPVVYQQEGIAGADWCRRHAGMKSDYPTLENSWKQEGLKIWNGESYDINNILANVNNTGTRGTIVTILNRLVNFKRTEKSFGDGAVDSVNGITQRNAHTISLRQFETWKEKNQQLQTQLTQAQQQVNQQQQAITNLNSQVTNLNSTNSQLQSQLTAAQLQNTQLQSDKNTLQQQNQSLNSQLEQTKKDKTTVEQELAKLKKEHATCTTTIQALEKEKVALQKQVDELNAIITGVPLETEARVQQANLPPK